MENKELLETLEKLKTEVIANEEKAKKEREEYEKNITDLQIENTKEKQEKLDAKSGVITKKNILTTTEIANALQLNAKELDEMLEVQPDLFLKTCVSRYDALITDIDKQFSKAGFTADGKHILNSFDEFFSFAGAYNRSFLIDKDFAKEYDNNISNYINAYTQMKQYFGLIEKKLDLEPALASVLVLWRDAIKPEAKIIEKPEKQNIMDKAMDEINQLKMDLNDIKNDFLTKKAPPNKEPEDMM